MEEKNSITELNQEQLDKISGGVVTDKAAFVFDALIVSLKKYDKTMDSAINFVRNDLSFDNPLLAGTTPDDAATYIETRWNQISIK